MKGPPEVSSDSLSVRPSVRLSVCPYVYMSVIPSRLQSYISSLPMVDDTVNKLGL